MHTLLWKAMGIFIKGGVSMNNELVNYDHFYVEDDDRIIRRPYGYGRRPYGYGRSFGYGFGRPYGYGFGGPFLGGVLGGLLGSALIPPYGYPYPYPYYGGYPFYGYY